MKQFRRISVLIFALIMLYMFAFSSFAFGVPSTADLESENKPNVVGVICWIVIGLGVLFIIYVLFSSNNKKKKSGMRPKQNKYRRSPYKKKHRHMEEEYFKYKRNKYK